MTAKQLVRIMDFLVLKYGDEKLTDKDINAFLESLPSNFNDISYGLEQAKTLYNEVGINFIFRNDGSKP